MTQIFTGTGLGTQGSSLGQLGTYGPKGCAKLGSGGESVYVNAATGNLYLTQSDGFLSGLSLGFDIVQHYNSRGESTSPWLFNIETRLLIEGASNEAQRQVKRVDEDGHLSVFTYDTGKKAYLAVDGRPAKLIFTGTDWQYQEGSSQTRYHYNSEGQLTHLSDADGHVVFFHYERGILTRMDDSLGKQRVTWSFENGLVTDVTVQSDDEVVQHLHYSYDQYHRLSRISRDLSEKASYWISYDYVGDSTLISDIRQSDRGNLHIDYDKEGRVLCLTDGEGRQSTYQYLSGATLVTSGDEAWTYTYDKDGRLTGIDGPLNTHVRYSYDGHYLSRITQGTRTWQFEYNEAGDCLSVSSPTAGVTRYTYDASHHRLSTTHYQAFDEHHKPPSPLTTRYVYDERGHLSFEISPLGTVTAYRYNRDGLCINRRRYLEGQFDNSDLSLADHVSSETLIQWESAQHPQQVSLVAYRYDWRGNLTEEVHYTDVDNEGNGLLTPEALIYYSRYDARGLLVEKSVPTKDGMSSTHYVYDKLGRLIQTIDNQGRVSHIEYDDAHQRILSTDTNGLQHVALYDHSGLLLASHRFDSTHDYGKTTYRYDNAGRLIAETGVDGNTVFFFYDQKGRLSARVTQHGAALAYEYNDNDEVVLSHCYERLVDTRDFGDKLPEWACIKPATTENDRLSQSLYNDEGQLVYHIDASLAVIAYRYDATHQVIAKTAYANRLTGVDLNQRLTLKDLTLITSPDDRLINYYYDKEGRLLADINGEGLATTYLYDKGDHLWACLEFANKATEVRTGDWRLDAPLSNPQKDCYSYRLYNKAGLHVATIDKEGYVTESRYDNRGLVQETIAYATKLNASLIITEYTTLEAIRPSAHPNDHHTGYRYDDLNQLIEERSKGLLTHYVYNEAGLLISKTSEDGRTHERRDHCYRYDALGRIIARLDAIGAETLRQTPGLSLDAIEAIWQAHSESYTYDLKGHRLSCTNALKQCTRYFYNEQGLLVYTLGAAGSITETRYNAFQDIETTIRYHVPWQGNEPPTVSLLAAYIAKFRDVRLDEVTTTEHNSLGLIVGKHQGGLYVTQSYNAFGEINEDVLHTTLHETITRYQYDHRGQWRYRLTEGDGFKTLIEAQYDTLGHLVKTVDARGFQQRYWSNKRGETLLVEDALHGRKVMTYDAFGRLLSVDDKTRVTYTYDDTQQTLSLTHPGGSTLVTEFNAFGDTLTITDAHQQRTRFSYDAKGQLVHKESPGEQVYDYHYDEAGQVWREDNQGQIIEYDYDAEGRVLTKTLDPNGLNLVTCFSYDGIGRQLSITEGTISTQFTYDNQGHLIKKCVDPEGLNLITTFLYDEKGALLTQTIHNPDGVNQVTTFSWDALNRCVQQTRDATGLTLKTTYAYDLNNNLISQTDAKGQKTQYVYDANNRLHYRIDARGVVTEHVYSVKGMELQTITYDLLVDTTPLYDEMQLKAVIKTNDSDHYQFFAYDAQNRLMRSYDGLGFATSFTYDANDNCLSIERHAIASSLEALKRGERPEPAASLASRRTHFAYDAANQVRFKVEPDNRLTEYRYDSAGNVIQTTRYKKALSPLNDYALTAIKAHLQVDEEDQCTHARFDAAKRLSAEASPLGFVTTYQYDERDKLIATTRFDKALPADAFSLDNWPMLLQTSLKDRTIRSFYDNAGREIYRMSATGQVQERRFDALGNVLTAIVHAKHVSLSARTLEAIAEELNEDVSGDVSTRYLYDAVGRLDETIDALNHHTTYTYDNNDNLCAKEDGRHARWTYDYDEVNQLIATFSPETRVSRWVNGQLIDEVLKVKTENQYDSVGNLIKVVRDAGGLAQTVYYRYDAENRLIATITPNVAINNAAKMSSTRNEVSQTLSECLTYNAFGELIEKCDQAGFSRHFVYDAAGRLCYQVDANHHLTTFTMDAFDKLQSKTMHALPLPSLTAYTFSSITNALTTSEDDRHTTYVYDKDNRLIEKRLDAIRSYNPQTQRYDVLSPSTRLSYNAFGEVVEEAVQLNAKDWARTRTYFNDEGLIEARLDAEGYLTTYSYTVFNLLSEEVQYAIPTTDRCEPPTSPKDRHISFSYDALGQLTTKTLHNVTHQRLTNNTLQTITEDLKSHYRYDALGNVVMTIDALGHKAYHYYNNNGQLIAKVGPQVNAGRALTTYRVNALGERVESRQWAAGALSAHETQFTAGPASSDDIIQQTIYDKDGHIIQQIDGTGHALYYSVDANGNIARTWHVLTQVDKSLIIHDKRYRFDAENRLLAVCTLNAGGETSEDSRYNAFGELIAKGINGVMTTYTDYDQAGRIWRTNKAGYVAIYLYDLSEHVTQVVTSTNAWSAQYGELGVDLSLDLYKRAIAFNQPELMREDNRYDALGRLLSQTKAARLSKDNTTPSTISQSQTLDRWGNIITHTNANGYTTSYEYNAFDQVIREERPLVNVMDETGHTKTLSPILYIAYDALGREIAITDVNGHQKTKVLDANGRILQETDARGFHRQKVYNLLGELGESRDERNTLTTYRYDHANRLIEIISPQTMTAFTYDGKGQLIQQTDGAGSTRYWFDALGHQIKRESAASGESLFTYDDAGHKLSEIDANGKRQSWTYDTQGRLQTHSDLGAHETRYTYNYNGLLLTERSTAGKDIAYHYYSDGELQEYADLARHDVMDYSYDNEGNVTRKESTHSQTGLVERDYYHYDSLGRLSEVRRKNPDTPDTGLPDKDLSLLSIDYAYDAVGNIRHTEVITQTQGKKNQLDDYFRYDENNRIVVNKGQLQNGRIEITARQGSELAYDEAGNIVKASRHEHGVEQTVSYRYNAANQLEGMYKNGYAVKTAVYDKSGRILEENRYDARGYLAERQEMTYDAGRLSNIVTTNRYKDILSRTHYAYDLTGNLNDLTTIVPSQSDTLGYTQHHQYSYALWDSYQQALDEASLKINGRTNTGKSERHYDVNGQLQEAIDSKVDANGVSNSTYYRTSSLDGILERRDKEGQTSYLHVAGKVIGDLHTDKRGVTRLDVYAGFTPMGHQATQPQTTSVQPEEPQDNIGTYTLQAGDTLENIALQVYGDASLWYLLADANGLTNRDDHAGEKGSQLHIGQRLTIPPTARAHHSNKTHHVLKDRDWQGQLSATTPLPLAPPAPKPHHSFWQALAMVTVAVIASIATVMSAGLLGVLTNCLAHVNSITGLMAAGSAVLGGALSLPTTLTIGFTAGFIGSLAAQSAATAFGLQQALDVPGALFNGLASATTGVASALKGTSKLSPATEFFNVDCAVDTLERDVLNQSLNLATRRHQHLDWLELALCTAQAGVMGSQQGQRLNNTLNNHLGKATPLIESELQSLTTTAITRNPMNVTDILLNELGNTIGNNLIQTASIIGQDELITAATSTVEHHSEAQQETEIVNTSLASLIEAARKKAAITVGDTQGAWKEDNFDAYENLRFHSSLFKSTSDMEENQAFEDNVLWGTKYGVKPFMKDSFASVKRTLDRPVSNFDLLQHRIFDHEGGISNHPNDYGGYTNKGITIGTFKSYAKIDLGIEPTIENLRNLTNEQAAVIYKKRFWDPIRADEINSPSVAYSFYDFYVNAPKTAVQLMQESVNSLGAKLKIDNKMGPKTLRAINSVNPRQLFEIYQQKRINHYINRVKMEPNQRVFLKGWLDRVNNIKFEM